MPTVRPTDEFHDVKLARRGRPAVVAERTPARQKSRIFERYSTTTPPNPPPELRCPSCDRALAYQESFIGGVSADFTEQWDQLVCEKCGRFEYRHRTRKLRRAAL